MGISAHRAVGRGRGSVRGDRVPDEDLESVADRRRIECDREPTGDWAFLPGARQTLSHLVKPFQLTDNFTELGKYTIKEQFTEWFRKLGIPMGRAQKGRFDDWASIKSAAKQLNWLPTPAEIRYGEESHKEETNIRSRGHKLGKKYYPFADEMLKRILASVGQETDYAFQLFILKNSNNDGGGNAVARPGGFLYIDEGLIRTRNGIPRRIRHWRTKWPMCCNDMKRKP